MYERCRNHTSSTSSRKFITYPCKYALSRGAHWFFENSGKWRPFWWFALFIYLFIFLRLWSFSFIGPASWDWPWEFLQWCRSVASELPSDITLDVDGHKFHLHKVVLPSHPITYFQSMLNFYRDWLQIYLLLPNSFLCTTHVSEDMLMYSNSDLCPMGVLEVLQRPRRCVQFLKFTIPLRCHST